MKNNFRIFSKSPNFVENYSEKMIFLKDVVNEQFFNPYFMLNLFHILEYLEISFQNDDWFKKLKNKNKSEIILKNSVENELVVSSLFNCFNLKMIEKKCFSNEIVECFINEYEIGTSVLNYLRFIIPNFVFTFYIEQKNSNIYKNPKICIDDSITDSNNEKDYISVHSEFINSLSFKEFNKLVIETDTYTDFLLVFYQIVCSLEVAQQTFQFSHNDAHLGNILIRKNHQNEIIQYPIFDKIYEFQNNLYIPTFIDFGYSVGKINEKEQIKNSVFFPEYGYLPIFIPGNDIMKICINIYGINIETESPIKYFIQFILEYFFQINIKVFMEHSDTISNYFYNMFHSSVMYKNPLQLLDFCNQHKETIFKIFSISTFSMTIYENPKTFFNFLQIRNKKYEEYKEILEYLNISTFYKINLKKKLYNYFTPSKYPKYIFANDLVTNIPKINFPNILFSQDERRNYPDRESNQSDALYFILMKYNWFICNYEYFLYIYLFDESKYYTSKISFFLENIIILTSIYRNLCFLQEYIHFTKKYKIKITKNTILYEKLIQKLFEIN